VAKGGKKEITKVFKIQAPAGQATPAPPIGPALGANGVNPGQFVTQFNEATRPMQGSVVGCVITVYSDRSFTFEIKKPPVAEMIKNKLKLQKGSGTPNSAKVGKLTAQQCREIAQEKASETTGHSVEAIMRTVAGTARSMGVETEAF
jgi:large subunit ribosomal protein L11